MFQVLCSIMPDIHVFLRRLALNLFLKCERQGHFFHSTMPARIGHRKVSNAYLSKLRPKLHLSFFHSTNCMFVDVCT